MASGMERVGLAPLPNPPLPITRTEHYENKLLTTVTVGAYKSRSSRITPGPQKSAPGIFIFREKSAIHAALLRRTHGFHDGQEDTETQSTTAARISRPFGGRDRGGARRAGQDS